MSLTLDDPVGWPETREADIGECVCSTSARTVSGDDDGVDPAGELTRSIRRATIDLPAIGIDMTGDTADGTVDSTPLAPVADADAVVRDTAGVADDDVGRGGAPTPPSAATRSASGSERSITEAGTD